MYMIKMVSRYLQMETITAMCSLQPHYLHNKWLKLDPKVSDSHLKSLGNQLKHEWRQKHKLRLYIYKKKLLISAELGGLRTDICCHTLRKTAKVVIRAEPFQMVLKVNN